MTTTNELLEFRVLPLGDAKASTNDDTGDQAPEDEFVKYDHP